MQPILLLDSIVLLTLVGAVLDKVHFDDNAHIATAEDTVQANRRIPRSLLWSTSANAILCIIVAILICLCAGNVNELFTGTYGASGHPIGSIIQLTYNAANGNKALASAPFGLVCPISTYSVGYNTRIV